MMNRYAVWTTVAALGLGMTACRSAPTQKEIEMKSGLAAVNQTSQDDWSKIKGVTWNVSLILSKPVMTDAPITLSFGEGGRLSAKAANTFSGSVEQSDPHGLKVGPVASTKMFRDTPAGTMDQESAFAKALGSVTGYQLIGNRLALLAGNETVLLLTR